MIRLAVGILASALLIAPQQEPCVAKYTPSHRAVGWSVIDDYPDALPIPALSDVSLPEASREVRIGTGVWGARNLLRIVEIDDAVCGALYDFQPLLAGDTVAVSPFEWKKPPNWTSVLDSLERLRVGDPVDSAGLGTREFIIRDGEWMKVEVLSGSHYVRYEDFSTLYDGPEAHRMGAIHNVISEIAQAARIESMADTLEKGEGHGRRRR